MSAPQAAAITACTACAAVGGAAAGGAFSSGSTVDENHTHEESNPNSPTTDLPSSSPIPEEEPKWYPLSNEITAGVGTYDSKIGKEYSIYLVGAYGTDGKATNKWWEKSYEKYKADKETGQDKTPRTFSTEFDNTKVTQAFDNKGGSVATALNRVCDTLYQQKTKEDIPLHVANSGDSKAKLRDDFWRYCSPLGVAPINLETQTTTYTTGKIGHTKKDTLLSAKENENTMLWSLKQQEFFGLKKVTDTYFKALWESRESKKSESNSFRDKCKDAYEKTPPGQRTSEPTAEKVEQYCSLKAMPIEQ